MRKYAIVTTTINVPLLLQEYAADAKKHDSADLKFIIAGDKKTPDEAIDFCRKIEKIYGIPVEFMNTVDQEKYLQDKQALAAHIPWNCIQRRNIAILKAWEEGFDTIITIDDDNFLSSENYLKGHHQVGKVVEIDALKNNTRWFNICDFLKDENGRDYFPRGYAVSERILSRIAFTSRRIKAKVVVNGGLWLGDPDIDAVTRLAGPINAVQYTRNENFALDFNVWCPFNSQNTALSREVIPAYFLSPFIGRFDDIWGSYFVKRISDHLGDVVSYGYPLVKQDRNEHDLFHDFELEKMGLQLTEMFCEWLDTAKLTGVDYLQCAEELIEHIQFAYKKAEIAQEYKEKIGKFVDGYMIWTRTIRQIAGNEKN